MRNAGLRRCLDHPARRFRAVIVAHRARQPARSGPPSVAVHDDGDMQHEALTAGIERHIIESVPVPITVPAKTVADCFKHRRKVGLDVAIEALKDCVRPKRATADELWRYAAICRVQNVLRPYLEATL